MNPLNHALPEARAFLYAGLLYLAVIVLGLGAELGLRLPVMSAADAGAALAARPFVPALSLLADSLMVAADVALALLLFVVLAPAGALLAAFAALFRLIQAAVLAANLTHLQDSALHLSAGAPESALRALELHAAGYDIGLVFFGLSCFATGALVMRHAGLPVWLGAMIVLTGAVYIVGTSLRVALPEAFALYQPAYLVAIVTETAFALTLLSRGLPASRRAAGGT